MIDYSASVELVSADTWKTEIYDFAEKFVSDNYLNEHITTDMCIVLEELVSNYFKYAVRPQYRFGVNIHIQALPREMSLIIQYEGDDFNPFDYHLQEAAGISVEQAKVGGKGIHIVKRISKSCEYRREGNSVFLTIIIDRIMESEMQIEEIEVNQVTVLALDGRLDIISADELQKKMDEVLDVKQRLRILIDCEKLSFISSAGLRLFMIALKKLNKTGGKIAFCSFNLNNRKIFEITGYDKFFTIFESRTEALEALSA